MKGFKGFLAVAVVLTVAGTLPVYSQTSSTAVLGTVTDATGAVLVGAKVTLLQVQTGIKRQDTTSGTGDYNFPLLDPGEPTVIHIFKAAPKLDGTSSGKPGEVYFVATIQAELKLAGVLNFTGFLRPWRFSCSLHAWTPQPKRNSPARRAARRRNGIPASNRSFVRSAARLRRRRWN